MIEAAVTVLVIVFAALCAAFGWPIAYFVISMGLAAMLSAIFLIVALACRGVDKIRGGI